MCAAVVPMPKLARSAVPPPSRQPPFPPPPSSRRRNGCAQGHELRGVDRDALRYRARRTQPVPA